MTIAHFQSGVIAGHKTVIVNLLDQYVSSIPGPTGSLSCEYQLDGDQGYRPIGGGFIDIGDWVDPKSEAPGLYEIMCTDTGGPDPINLGDSLDTWLALTSTRSWGIALGVTGGYNATGTVSIRYDGGPPLDTANLEWDMVAI